MDVTDMSDALMERVSKAEIDYRNPTLKPMGACWFCGEEVGQGQIFCHNGHGDDRGCAGDYEKLIEAKKRTGQ